MTALQTTLNASSADIGRDRRRHRRRRLDLDLLSDRRNRRDSAERLAGAGVLDPHLSLDQRDPVSRVFRRLRLGAGPAADDRAARAARFYRRRADPDGLYADHHAAAEGKAARGSCAVRAVRHFRTAIGPTIGGYLTENW